VPNLVLIISLPYYNTERDYSAFGFGKRRVPTEAEKIHAPDSVQNKTIMADLRSIPPEYRSYTSSGLSDMNQIKTFNRQSQFSYDAPTARERMLLRMFDVLGRESPEMKKFIEDFITVNPTLSVGSTYTQVLDCGCCGNPITVSHPNGRGLSYKTLRSHILGFKHGPGRIVGEPLAGCYASIIPCGCGDTMSDWGDDIQRFNVHKAACKFSESFAKFKIWRGKKENHTAKTIPSTGQFDCGGDIGVVSYDAMRKWLGRVTGKAAYGGTGGKKEAVTGKKKAVLEPLIRGMNCYPTEWKSDSDS